jgi:hypothetical protein
MPDSVLEGVRTFYPSRTRRRGNSHQLDRMLLPNPVWAEGWRSFSTNTGERVESSCPSPWLSGRARGGSRQPRQDLACLSPPTIDSSKSSAARPSLALRTTWPMPAASSPVPSENCNLTATRTVRFGTSYYVTCSAAGEKVLGMREQSLNECGNYQVVRLRYHKGQIVEELELLPECCTTHILLPYRAWAEQITDEIGC